MRILTVRAGVGGMTLGTLLERLGVGATVVERASSTRHAGYMLGLYALGHRVLHGLGLYARFEAKDVAYKHYVLGATRPQLVDLLALHFARDGGGRAHESVRRAGKSPSRGSRGAAGHVGRWLLICSCSVAPAMACTPRDAARAPSRTMSVHPTTPCLASSPNTTAAPPQAAPPSDSTVMPWVGRRGIVWAPSGERVAAVERPPAFGGSRNAPPPQRQVRVVDVHSRNEWTGFATAVEDSESAQPLAFRKDSEKLVLRRPDGSIVEWSFRTNTLEPSEFDAPARGGIGLCLAPDDVHLLVFDSDGNGAFRSRLDDSRVVFSDTELTPSPVRDCVFSPDSKRVAVAGDAGLAIYAVGPDGPTLSVRWSMPDYPVWSTNGKKLAFHTGTSWGQTLFAVLDPGRRAIAAQVIEGLAVLDAAANRLVVRSDRDVWSVMTLNGELVGVRTEPEAQGSPVHEMALSPDGSNVAALVGGWGGNRLELHHLRKTAP